jgi:hypothetical protein
VVAVRTEREPNRYEPLNETHRRVAEEEEKRRLAEQEQARSALSEPEPFRPGTEPRPHRPETVSERDPDSPEARLAAKEQELQEQVRLGRINPSEMIHQLRQFDDELRIEIEHGGMSPQHGSPSGRQSELSAEAELENAQVPERVEDIRDQPTEESRDDPTQRTPEARIEREAEAAEYEIVGRGEMTDGAPRA